MKSASYEYRKMSARRGAQIVPIGMPTVCWKTFPAKTTKILSTRNSSILKMSSSEYLFLESECSFTKYVSLCPYTKYLYLRWEKCFTCIFTVCYIVPFQYVSGLQQAILLILFELFLVLKVLFIIRHKGLKQSVIIACLLQLVDDVSKVHLS